MSELKKYRVTFDFVAMDAEHASMIMESMKRKNDFKGDWKLNVVDFRTDALGGIFGDYLNGTFDK